MRHEQKGLIANHAHNPKEFFLLDLMVVHATRSGLIGNRLFLAPQHVPTPESPPLPKAGGHVQQSQKMNRGRLG
jgi:hypothetical protein